MHHCRGKRRHASSLFSHFSFLNTCFVHALFSHGQLWRIDASVACEFPGFFRRQKNAFGDVQRRRRPCPSFWIIPWESAVWPLNSAMEGHDTFCVLPVQQCVSPLAIKCLFRMLKGIFSYTLTCLDIRIFKWFCIILNVKINCFLNKIIFEIDYSPRVAVKITIGWNI